KALSDKASLDLNARSLEYNPATKLLVVAEENVAADPRQANVADNQVIRVFAGAIHEVAGKRPVDPNWDNRPRNIWQQYELRVKRMDEQFDQRLKELHERALAAGKWKGTSAVHDRENYWSSGVLSYFDAPGQDSAPAGSQHPIATREALHDYDVDLHALVHETFAYGGKVDWRLRR